MDDDNLAQCPRCNMIISISDIDHCDSCEGVNQKIQCCICEKFFAPGKIHSHINSCLAKSEKVSKKASKVPKKRGPRLDFSFHDEIDNNSVHLSDNKEIMAPPPKKLCENEKMTMTHKKFSDADDTSKFSKSEVQHQKLIPPKNSRHSPNNTESVAALDHLNAEPEPMCFKKRSFEQANCTSKAPTNLMKVISKRMVKPEPQLYDERNSAEDLDFDIFENNDEKVESNDNLTYDEFQKALNQSFAVHWGSRIILESSMTVRGNKVLEGRDCMYGGIYPAAMDLIIRRAKITSEDVFLDIGSGIGQTVLQVAACTGARCLGIEIEETRHTKSTILYQAFRGELLRLKYKEMANSLPGKIELLQGCFKNYADRIQESTVIYFNNFAGYFDNTRPSDRPENAFFQNLEQCLVEILKWGIQGARVITLNELHYVPNGWRVGVQHFTLKREKLGEAACSWTNDLDAFIYTVSPRWQCRICTLIHEEYGEYEDACSCGTRAVRSRRT